MMLVIVGCQKENEPTVSIENPQPGVCKKEAAQTLVGKGKISDEYAMKVTGATIVRQIKPGDPVTMDMRQERVTVETDEATGKIVRSFCG
ncbi:hypothetical protein CQZ93_24155 [Ochrobactrum vermis]|nr:hypothetical protein CQZ93_24155 [Ochrobactrum vermis]